MTGELNKEDSGQKKTLQIIAEQTGVITKELNKEECLMNEQKKRNVERTTVNTWVMRLHKNQLEKLSIKGTGNT